MARFLGIDCGATHLRVGLFDSDGSLLSNFTTNSPLKHQPENIARVVKDKLGAVESIEGIGLGVPGPLEIEKGLILPSSNIGNIAPIPILSIFDRVFNIKVQLDRDTNVALVGELWQGAAVGMKDVIMLTLGSGVGGAIISGGEIEHGASGRAGEIGHMHMNIEADLVPGDVIPCGLGHRDCLEALINSTTNLDEISIYLGYGLANIVDIFNPQKVIIGGGKTRMGDFLPKAKEIMKEVGLKPAVDEVVVEYAKLKDMSGVYGAARLAIENYDQHKNT
jgi:glucokinase